MKKDAGKKLGVELLGILRRSGETPGVINGMTVSPDGDDEGKVELLCGLEMMRKGTDGAYHITLSGIRYLGMIATFVCLLLCWGCAHTPPKFWPGFVTQKCEDQAEVDKFVPVALGIISEELSRAGYSTPQKLAKTISQFPVAVCKVRDAEPCKGADGRFLPYAKVRGCYIPAAEKSFVWASNARPWREVLAWELNNFLIDRACGFQDQSYTHPIWAVGGPMQMVLERVRALK